MRVKLQDILDALKNLPQHVLNQDAILLDDMGDVIPVDFGRETCTEQWVFFTVEDDNE
jgi:hypothetical protein